MAGTQISQQRKAVVVSGTVKYTITTTCTVAGTLQDTAIFLLDIITPSDPKDDVFSRIIEIADITNYSTDRDAAIASATATSWRSSSTTITYDDIETANAAWKEFNSRINDLVNNYDTFLTEFDTFDAGAVITFPTVDESAKTALKDAYYATVPLVTDAQAALTAHDTGCAQEETDLDNIESNLQTAQADLVPLLNIQAVLSALSGSYTSVYATLNINNAFIRAANTGSDATDVEKDNIEASLRSNDAVLGQLRVNNDALHALLVGNVATAVSTLQDRIATLTQDKNNMLVQINKCHTESSKLQAAVTTAIANREAALAAVVAVCPDFTP